MRLPPKLPLTDADWQTVGRMFGAYVAELPTSDAEWVQAMRVFGVADRVGIRLPTSDAEWQTYFVRPMAEVERG